MIQATRNNEPKDMTAHAYLLAFGEYADRIGIRAVFRQVPLRQKTYQHTPQSKVLEAFVGTVAGIEHLKDLSQSGHPIDQDEWVAQAWGEKRWADYSGVSRTLQHLSMEEVKQVIGGLQRINQAFTQREIAAALAESGYLVVDGDLSGLPVCKQSTRYPQVAYGHMNDVVRLGYQVGLMSLRSQHYGRLWLSVDHHPGNVTSTTQALHLVTAAEAAMGRRPLRRTDLLQQRIAQAEQVGSGLQAQVEKHTQAWQGAQAAQMELKQALQAAQQQVDEFEKSYAEKERPERSYSHLAKAHQQLESLRKRLIRQAESGRRIQKSLERSQHQWEAHEQAALALKTRLEGLLQDNAHNPTPVPIRLRLDAGFGSYDNLALLIEMGYELYTKARSAQVVRSLRKAVPLDHAWVRVGVDALLATWPGFGLPNFLYPVQVAVAQFKDAPHVKHAVLLYFGTEPLASQPQAWYDFYNARQTIEAGIKEQKHVFYLHRLKVRSLPAIVLQEYLVLFAANFVRWALAWMHTLPPPPPPFHPHSPAATLKPAVQVGSHTSAFVHRSPAGQLIEFTPLSCFFRQALWLPAHPSPPPKKVPIFPPFLWFAQWLHKT
jgi:hypothetical protein